MVNVFERITHQLMGTVTSDISIWIIDDHHEFRETLQELLSDQPDMICTASLASCERLLDQVFCLPKPDVVLMDINFKGRMSGSDGIRALRKIMPGIKVLLLSMYRETDLIFEALQSGALGYLFKMGSTKDLTRGIRDLVRTGMLPLPSTLAEPILSILSPSATLPEELTLTANESQLLAYLKDGLSYKQLPHQMHVDEATVDSYFLEIYHKLHQTDQINPK